MDLERASLWSIIFTAIGGIIYTTWRVVQWIATIRDEHEMLLKHLEAAKDHHLEIHDLKLGQARADRERDTLLAEVRGLREDLNDFMTSLVLGKKP